MIVLKVIRQNYEEKLLLKKIKNKHCLSTYFRYLISLIFPKIPFQNKRYEVLKILSRLWLLNT